MTGKVKLDCGDVELATQIAGEGPPVLLLHGFPDSCRLWRHQIEALAANGYRAIAPDLRGYGDSDKPEGVENYSLVHVVGDLTSLLDELGIERAHLVGHDFGAATAWVTASFLPERVASLTVLSVGHPAMLREASYEQLTRSWYMFMFQFEGVAERWLSKNDWEFARLFFAGKEDLDEYIEELSRPGALTAALNWYRANLAPDTWLAGPPQIPPVTVPTMGIWSTEDIALLEEQMMGSQKHVQGPWRYERLEGVGHWIPTEAPDRLNALLLDFLSNVN